MLTNDKLYLIGNPVLHSVSPMIHNTISALLGLPFTYSLREPSQKELPAFVQEIRESASRGFNITVPFKQDIIPYLDKIDNAAREIGAVNTVVNDNGILTGYNTDAPGFLKALAHDGIPYQGKTVAVLGAGGAAMGVCYALTRNGAGTVHIFNRTQEKAKALAAALGGNTTGHPLCDFSKLAPRADLVINTTSAGLSPDTNGCPVSEIPVFKRDAAVVDIIYNPPQTRLLKEAQAQGQKTQNGLLMLLYQGVIAYELWADLMVPNHVISTVFEKLQNHYS